MLAKKQQLQLEVQKKPQQGDDWDKRADLWSKKTKKNEGATMAACSVCGSTMPNLALSGDDDKRRCKKCEDECMESDHQNDSVYQSVHPQKGTADINHDGKWYYRDEEGMDHGPFADRAEAEHNKQAHKVKLRRNESTRAGQILKSFDEYTVSGPPLAHAADHQSGHGNMSGAQIHKSKSGNWYFKDSHGTNHGPYTSEKDAREAHSKHHQEASAYKDIRKSDQHAEFTAHNKNFKNEADSSIDTEHAEDELEKDTVDLEEPINGKEVPYKSILKTVAYEPKEAPMNMASRVLKTLGEESDFDKLSNKIQDKEDVSKKEADAIAADAWP